MPVINLERKLTVQRCDAFEVDAQRMREAGRDAGSEKLAASKRQTFQIVACLRLPPLCSRYAFDWHFMFVLLFDCRFDLCFINLLLFIGVNNDKTDA